jgi:hypothetical protein
MMWPTMKGEDIDLIVDDSENTTIQWSTPHGAQFKHRPLDINKKEIRLIEFKLEPDHRINCYIHHFELSTAPPYYAVSYMWGDESDEQNVTIEGQPFKVRRILYDYLTTYECRLKARTLL